MNIEHRTWREFSGIKQILHSMKANFA